MRRQVSLLLAFSLLLAACGPAEPPIAPTTGVTSGTRSTTSQADTPVETRVEELLAQMTLAEKIGQMTQVEKNSIKHGDITRYAIGSILSGGGGYPPNNTATGWTKMVDQFQEEALATRLGIPLLYGIDAVHGHGALYGATIFPHQIGLGAARDADLVRRIGRATAEELMATGIRWNFAPVVAVPQDIRWGRTYESYAEDRALVGELGTAYLLGLQSLPAGYVAAAGQTLYVLATPKHFLGDGGTTFGTSTQYIEKRYLLDQGDMQLDEAAVRRLFLPPYQLAVENGAMSVMVSFSSWNGTKMHAQTHWISEVLKGELRFDGIVVSDWGGLDQISGDYYAAIVTGINAGIDMNMVPYDYVRFIQTMEKAVRSGDITEARINDAVRRILTVKFRLGLFERPYVDAAMRASVGSEAHRALAREAVRKSLVLLRNESALLPIAKDTPLIYVAGRGADDIGMQCGGWTIEWQGESGDIQPGTTILGAVRSAVSEKTKVEFNLQGKFTGMADIGIVIVGEAPYAEGVGDASDLSLSQADVQAITNLRAHSRRLVAIILSGRPLIITPQFRMADAWVAAWLPGTEGSGITDVLFGDYSFTGSLPYTWPRTNEQLPPRTNEQLPINNNNSAGLGGCDAPLLPFGYGLGQAGGRSVEWLDCP